MRQCNVNPQYRSLEAAARAQSAREASSWKEEIGGGVKTELGRAVFAGPGLPWPVPAGGLPGPGLQALVFLSEGVNPPKHVLLQPGSGSPATNASVRRAGVGRWHVFETSLITKDWLS